MAPKKPKKPLTKKSLEDMEGMGAVQGRPLPNRPTGIRPGPDKLRVMSVRWFQGKQLFHPRDASPLDEEVPTFLGDVAAGRVEEDNDTDWEDEI